MRDLRALRLRGGVAPQLRGTHRLVVRAERHKAKLAAAKKVDGLSDASDKAYETCTTCHNKYWADRNNPK